MLAHAQKAVTEAREAAAQAGVKVMHAVAAAEQVLREV